MLEVIGTYIEAGWAFVSDKNNRESLTWLGGGILAAFAAFKTFFSGKKPAKDDDAKPSPEPKQEPPKSGTTNKVRAKWSFFVNFGDRKGVSTLLFVGFAAFVVFVVANAAPVPDRHVDARCAPDLVLPTDSRDAASVLNERGIYHMNSGEVTQALRCYEAAYKRDPNSWPIMKNLATTHMFEPGGDVEEGLRYAGLLVDYQKRQMLKPIEKSCLLDSMTCAERMKFTREGFSIEPWQFRALGFAKLGDFEAAISEMNEVLDLYPRKSCLFSNAEYLAVYYRTNVLCLARESDAALAGFEWLQRSSEWDEETRREIQRLMKASGHYHGLVDGQFGDQSKTALNAWARDGCPGTLSGVSFN